MKKEKVSNSIVTFEEQAEINYLNNVKTNTVFDWLENLDWGICAKCEQVAKKKTSEQEKKAEYINQVRLLLLEKDSIGLLPLQYYGCEQYDHIYEYLDDEEKAELKIKPFDQWIDIEKDNYLRWGKNVFEGLKQLTCWQAPWELFIAKNYDPKDALGVIEKILTFTELPFSFRVDVSNDYLSKNKPIRPKSFLDWLRTNKGKSTIVGDLADETYITELDFKALIDLRKYARTEMNETFYNCFIIVWNIYHREYLRQLTPFTDKFNLSKIYYYLDDKRFDNWENLIDDDYKISENGYVYIFKAENGLYKIGKSRNPEQRITQFKGSPVKVTILHLMESDRMSYHEAMLHKHFKTKRKHSEWFTLNSEDIILLTRFVNAKNLEFLDR